jgi:hypothetical protein
LPPSPKNENPFHLVPVAARTMALSDLWTLPSHSNPSWRTRTTMSFPWNRRTSNVPGSGSRGSTVGDTRDSTVRASFSGSFRKSCGARMRRSASLAISSARRRRAFREASLRVRLDAPGDPPEQKLLMIRTAFLAEDLAVLVLELAHGHVPEPLDLFPQGRGVDRLFSHGVNLAVP